MPVQFDPEEFGSGFQRNSATWSFLTIFFGGDRAFEQHLEYTVRNSYGRPHSNASV